MNSSERTDYFSGLHLSDFYSPLQIYDMITSDFVIMHLTEGVHCN